MADPVEQETFRTRLRLDLLERVVLITAFQTPVLSGQLTVDQSQQALEGWLDMQSTIADTLLGAHFQEPAQTGLYADEAREVIDRMKALVAQFAAVARETGLR